MEESEELLYKRSRDIYYQFCHMFPGFEKAVTHYSTFSRDRIRIELANEIILLFEYISKENWSLVTEESEEMRLNQ